MIQKATMILLLLTLSACELGSFDNPGITLTDISIYWSAPTQRVNGDTITLSDIAGYEIRYKEKSDTDYSYVLIANGKQDQAQLTDINKHGSYPFEVAAIVNYGIYGQ